jgi:hypothetical protein
MSRCMNALGLFAASAIAAPAAAQTYNPYPNQPPYDYPVYPGQPNPPTYPQTYPPYGYGGGGTIGSIIDQLLGGHYNVSDRQAVTQCASAALAEAQSRYSYYGYDGYNGYNGYGTPQVRAITGVERRSYDLRVSGLIGFGRGEQYGHGNGNGSGYGNDDRDDNSYGNGYGYANPPGQYGELTFRCDVDYRGNVTEVRVRPSGEYRRY